MTAEGTKVEGTIADRAHQCLKNVQAILEEAGSGLDRTVKSKFFFLYRNLCDLFINLSIVNVFLTDINDFAEFNKVYAQYFNTHKPARSCVAVKSLPLGVDVS